MPKISVYVPDAMYDELRRRQVAISQIAQEAFAQALRTGANADWIERARRRPVRTTSVNSENLMAEVDEEFGA